MAFLEGVSAPFAGVLNPASAFDKLRSLLDRFGPWALFPLWFGASATAVIVSTLVTYPLYVVSGFGEGFGEGLASIVLGVFASLYYSMLVPLVFGILDPLLILAALLPAPRERPVYYVFAARAGAMLPYALKPPLVLLSGGGLSLYSLLVPRDPYSLAIAIAGLLLTAYGVKKTVRTGFAWALLASLVAFAVRVAIGYASTL